MHKTYIDILSIKIQLHIHEQQYNKTAIKHVEYYKIISKYSEIPEDKIAKRLLLQLKSVKLYSYKEKSLEETVWFQSEIVIVLVVTHTKYTVIFIHLTKICGATCFFKMAEISNVSNCQQILHTLHQQVTSASYFINQLHL